LSYAVVLHPLLDRSDAFHPIVPSTSSVAYIGVSFYFLGSIVVSRKDRQLGPHLLSEKSAGWNKQFNAV
jgi:hypothetical protein